MEVDIKYWKKISENAPDIKEIEELEKEIEFDDSPDADMDEDGMSLSPEEKEKLKEEREKKKQAQDAKVEQIIRSKIERNYTVGLFFLNKAFEIAEIESNQQKDKEKITDCLKNCED